MQHFRSWAAPPFRRRSGRIRIALSLAASAHPLRGGASRPEPGASLDNRRLLLIRLQQFVAFQPSVQGSVRSSAVSISRRAGLLPSRDPRSMLVHGVSDAIVGLSERAGRGKRVACMDGFDAVRPRPGCHSRDRSCRRTEPVLAQKPKQTPYAGSGRCGSSGASLRMSAFGSALEANGPSSFAHGRTPVGLGERARRELEAGRRPQPEAPDDRGTEPHAAGGSMMPTLT